MGTTYYLVGLVLIFGGLATIVWPRQVGLFNSGWKFANPEDARLTDAYVAWLRISGAIGIATGIVLIVYGLR